MKWSLLCIVWVYEPCKQLSVYTNLDQLANDFRPCHFDFIRYSIWIRFLFVVSFFISFMDDLMGACIELLFFLQFSIILCFSLFWNKFVFLYMANGHNLCSYKQLPDGLCFFRFLLSVRNCFSYMWRE